MNSRLIIKLVAVVLVVLVTAFTSIKFLQSKPKINRKETVSITPVVTVEELKVTHYQTIIDAMGTIIPARVVTVNSRVTGEVLKLHPDFLVGGLLKKGELVAQLDDIDYKIIKMQRTADVKKSESELMLEQGQQDIAKREWELVGTDDNTTDADKELALRYPQLKSKQASLSSAKAALDKAQIDLGRTKITAPFNTLILSTNVQLGDQVNSQTTLAKLVGTDSFYVQVAVPMSKLGWINIPKTRDDKGAMTTIIAKGNRQYKGRIIKLLGDIEPSGKMARLLVEIKDPLQLKNSDKSRLLLGEYVNVKIEGKTLEDAISIPRTAYHNNSEVWVLNDQNQLKTVKAPTIWEERKTVFIKNGFKTGEKLITSELAFPVEGMELKIFTEQEAK